MVGDLPNLADLCGRPRWHARAACRGMEPSVFVCGPGQSTALAKAICESCEVRAECLEAALAHPETQGVWGGTSARQRRLMQGGNVQRKDGA